MYCTVCVAVCTCSIYIKKAVFTSMQCRVRTTYFMQCTFAQC